MNLHAIVSGAIGAVNPFIALNIKLSTGSVVNADFTRTPTYSTTTIKGQLQALSYDDIRQVDALNIQGERRKVYVNGTYNGIVRAAQKGGDLVQLPDGTWWKIALVTEYWPDWCSFVITLQDGS